MRSADKSLHKGHERHKRNFDARLRRLKYNIPSGSYDFLRKEQGTASEPNQKLAQVATGPYQVRKSDPNTVVIVIGDQEERVSRDRVELTPSPIDYAPVTGLRKALQLLSGTNGDGEGSVADDEERPRMRASTAGDENELIDSSESGGFLQSTQTLGNSEAQSGPMDLQEGEGTTLHPKRQVETRNT